MELRRRVLPGVDSTRVIGDGRLWSGHSTGYGITVLEVGAFDFWYRREEWSLEPRRVKVKEAGELHRDLAVHGLVNAHTMSIAASLVEDISRALGFGTAPTFARPVLTAGSAAERAAWRLHRSLTGVTVHRLHGESLAVAAIGAALSEGRRSEWRPVRRARPAIRRAQEVLHASLDRNLGLSALADAAELDRFTLLRAFRAELGLPPHAYLTHLRVARARTLLAEGRTAADVAQEVGLCDQSQLNRHFKRIVGVTPGAYARAMRSSRQ